MGASERLRQEAGDTYSFVARKALNLQLEVQQFPDKQICEEVSGHHAAAEKR
jgi:hypothetical protein